MEFVFVVPRERLFPETTPHGLAPFGAGRERSAGVERFERVVREHGFFVERERAERTPAWKQVIPYTVVTCEGRVLLLRRKPTGGDPRLHGKLSIGVGGHVEPIDAIDAEGARRDPVPAGSLRELEEELVLEGERRLRAVGLLNDDTNPVGAVHVGLVQVLALEGGGRVEVREHDRLEGRLVERAELERLLADPEADVETWSERLIELLDPLLDGEEAVPRTTPVGAS